MPDLSPAEIRSLVDAVPHWHHVMHFPHDIVSPGSYDPRELFALLQLPEDLQGKRVLDAGTRDGYFAFELERRGAEVLAVDYADLSLTGFAAAKRIYGSRVEYLQANLYDLDPERIGTFDIVLFLGVLYHLRHPLLALDRLRSLCRELLILESLTCDALVFTGFETGRPLSELGPGLLDVPIAQFLPVDRFHRDPTNKWVPNMTCLRALLEEARFAPGPSRSWGTRALIHARPVEDPTTQRWVNLDKGLWNQGS
jgi:tRNA (mo5U34)-methyltransferase